MAQTRRPTKRARRSSGPNTTHGGRPSSSRQTARRRRPKVTFDVEPGFALIYMQNRAAVDRCISQHFHSIRSTELHSEWGYPINNYFASECKVKGRAFFVCTNLRNGKTVVGFDVKLRGF